jgi:putative ABC transport system permease protein
MLSYFRRALRAHLHGGRLLFLLSIFGVALGVASVLCIQIINRSAAAALKVTAGASLDRRSSFWYE